jgi:uncharacterized membrane protein
MNYDQLMYFHLITVVPCFFIGAILLLGKKGGQGHKSLGKVYMILMMITSLITIFMPAQVGAQFLGHFGWIHSFSFLTFFMVPAAYLDIRKGRVVPHQRKMIGLYIGAILIAGGFTFVPGRYLYELFFTN